MIVLRCDGRVSFAPREARLSWAPGAITLMLGINLLPRMTVCIRANNS